MATSNVITNINSKNKELTGNFEWEYTYLDTTQLCLTKAQHYSYKNALKNVTCKKTVTLSEAKDFILRLREKAAGNPTIALVRIYVHEVGEAKDRELRYWDWRASENI